jgi:hypothetical protein
LYALHNLVYYVSDCAGSGLFLDTHLFKECGSHYFSSSSLFSSEGYHMQFNVFYVNEVFHGMCKIKYATFSCRWRNTKAIIAIVFP